MISLPNQTLLHDNGRDVDVGLDSLVGQNAAAVDVDLVSDGDVVAEDSDVLETRPAADGAVPANDGALNPGVVLDLGSGQEDAALEADAVAHDDVGSDGDVGSYPAVLADLGRGVDQDVAAVDERNGGRGQLLGALLGERREVQAGSGQEVLGLADIHPEAVQVERVELAVADHGGEGLLLDRGGPELDALQHRRVEDVDTGVDAVADELDGLLDEAVDARGVVRPVHDDTVLGRFLDLGHHNGALVAVGLVERRELLEGVLAGDVRVEDEERGVVLGQNLLRQLERSGGAKGLGFDRDGDVDSELFLVLHVAEMLG